MIYVRDYLIESGHDTLFLGGNGQGMLCMVNY